MALGARRVIFCPHILLANSTVARQPIGMSWTAVTFTTPEFEKYVGAWAHMIMKLGGTPIVSRVDSTGDWARNTGLKPSALLEVWNQITDPYFLYLDVDVSISEAPNLPDEPWDVGVVDNRVTTHKNRISAASLLFRKCCEAQTFLERWAAYCAARPGKDHDHMTRTIAQARGLEDIRVVDATGCIDWTPNGLRDDTARKPMEATILFKYPSRGRSDRFFRSLDSIVDNLADADHYHVAATLDLDDETMNCQEVRDRLATYSNLSVQWGASESKIHAINRSMPGVPWDIIVCMSDDMVFNCAGFDHNIRHEMAVGFPDLDGLLHFPDQNAKSALATMYIAGRAFYERFGYIYHPGFRSFWCDNLVQDIAQALDKYRYVDMQILLHLHPAFGQGPKDELYAACQKDWAADEALYLDLKSRNYDL